MMRQRLIQHIAASATPVSTPGLAAALGLTTAAESLAAVDLLLSLSPEVKSSAAGEWIAAVARGERRVLGVLRAYAGAHPGKHLVATTANLTQWKAASFDYFEIGGIHAATAEATANPVKATEAPSRANFVVRAGDVLVSTVRPNLRAVGQIDADRKTAGIALCGFSILRAPSPEIGAYVQACLVHDAGVHHLMRWNTGGAYPAIDRDVPDRGSSRTMSRHRLRSARDSSMACGGLSAPADWWKKPAPPSNPSSTAPSTSPRCWPMARPSSNGSPSTRARSNGACRKHPTRLVTPLLRCHGLLALRADPPGQPSTPAAGRQGAERRRPRDTAGAVSRAQQGTNNNRTESNP
jgi:hypothetical protein